MDDAVIADKLVNREESGLRELKSPHRCNVRAVEAARLSEKILDRKGIF